MKTSSDKAALPSPTGSQCSFLNKVYTGCRLTWMAQTPCWTEPQQPSLCQSQRHWHLQGRGSESEKHDHQLLVKPYKQVSDERNVQVCLYPKVFNYTKAWCEYITTTHISLFTDIQYKILPSWKNNLKEGGSLSKIIKMG